MYRNFHAVVGGDLRLCCQLWWKGVVVRYAFCSDTFFDQSLGVTLLAVLWQRLSRECWWISVTHIWSLKDERWRVVEGERWEKKSAQRCWLSDFFLFHLPLQHSLADHIHRHCSQCQHSSLYTTSVTIQQWEEKFSALAVHSLWLQTAITHTWERPQHWQWSQHWPAQHTQCRMYLKILVVSLSVLVLINNC